MVETTEMRRSTSEQPALTAGYWAAVLATVFTVAFVVLAVVFDGDEWKGIEDYARTFDTLQVIQLVPVLLLAPTVVVLLSSIHAVAPDSRKAFGMAGVVFSGVYAAIIGTNYMLQLLVVRLNVENFALEGLALLAMANPHSIFVSLETIGYGFFGLAMLFTSGAFSGKRRENWIRGLLLTSGLTGILGAITAPLGQEMLTLAGFGVSLLAFLAAVTLVAIFFRRLSYARSSAT